MKITQQNKLIQDLEVNHDRWSQQSNSLVRKINQGNSESKLSLEHTGKLEVTLCGEHYATHKIKPSFLQRIAIKRAITKAKDRILDNVLSKLGS